MVSNLKNRNVTVIFYRLRRMVFRTIVGVSMHPTAFHNCRTEEEVYKLIKTINEIRLKHSTSVCLSTLQHKSSLNRVNTNYNEFGTRFLWLTQSLETF